MITSEKPEKSMTVTLFRFFFILVSPRNSFVVVKESQRAAGTVALKRLVYQTDFRLDFGRSFYLGMDKFKMSMENLSAKLGDLHRSFK